MIDVFWICTIGWITSYWLCCFNIARTVITANEGIARGALLYGGVGFILLVLSEIVNIPPSNNIEIPTLHAVIFIILFLTIFFISSLGGGYFYERSYGPSIGEQT